MMRVCMCVCVFDKLPIVISIVVVVDFITVL